MPLLRVPTFRLGSRTWILRSSMRTMLRQPQVVVDTGASDLVLGQNLVALVNITIAGIYGSVNYPLTLIIIGFDTHPFNSDDPLAFHQIPSVIEFESV